MERMTRLRAIRLKYGISLVELERHSRVSNQYLSALELGNVSRTANNEEVLGCAIDEIIRSRKSSLSCNILTEDYFKGIFFHNVVLLFG